MKLSQILEARYATRGNPFIITWPDYSTNYLFTYATGETQAAFGIYSREEQLAVVARSKDEALREAIEVWMTEEQSGEFWQYSADDISFNQLARPAANPHEGLMNQVAKDLENREEWLDVYPIGTRDFY